MDSRNAASVSPPTPDQFARQINRLSQIIESIKENPLAAIDEKTAEEIRDCLDYLTRFNCGVEAIDSKEEGKYYAIYNQQSQSPIFFYGHHFKKPNLSHVQKTVGGLPAQNVYDKSSILDAKSLQQLVDDLSCMVELRRAGVSRFIKGVFPKESQKENCEAGFFAAKEVESPEDAMRQAVFNIEKNQDQYRLKSKMEDGEEKSESVRIVDKNGATFNAVCKKDDEIIWGSIGDGLIGFEFFKDNEVKTITLAHQDFPWQERVGFFAAKRDKAAKVAFQQGRAVPAAALEGGVEEVKFCNFTISQLEEELAANQELQGYKLKRIFIASNDICDQDYQDSNEGKSVLQNKEFSLQKRITDGQLLDSAMHAMELSQHFFMEDPSQLYPPKDALAFVVDDAGDKNFIASISTGCGPRGADVAKMLTQELQKQVGVEVELEDVAQKDERGGALLQAAAAAANNDKSPLPDRKVAPTTNLLLSPQGPKISNTTITRRNAQALIGAQRAVNGGGRKLN